MSSQNKESSDKRGAPRFAISQMIEVRYDRERWVHAHGIDLSTTGFRCRTMEELDPGTAIYLLLSLDDTREITADAILIHTESTDDGHFEAGFAFTNFYGSSRSHLEGYLASLNPAT